MCIRDSSYSDLKDFGRFDVIVTWVNETNQFETYEVMILTRNAKNSNGDVETSVVEIGRTRPYSPDSRFYQFLKFFLNL